MADSAGERTQDPTPRRRQQAREKGQVAFSQDLGSAALLLVGVCGLMFFGGRIGEFFADLLHRQLSDGSLLAADHRFALHTYDWLIAGLAKVLLPLFTLIFIAGIAASVLQTGFLFVPSRLAPDIGRLNPLKGVQRIVSLQGLMRLGFGLFKVMIISIVAGVAIYLRRQELLNLSDKDVGQIATLLVSILFTTALWCGVALFLLAIFDYAFQRWKHEKDIRMSQQEVREEMKEMQGDPHIAARRRAVQRQMVLNRVGDAVPRADVVVTNPTELSIAIQYDPAEMAAPVVVAKGAGVIAQRIRRLALEHGVPIVERKPLARLLYKTVDVNQPIPDESYAAVAEVLAYVYQLKGKPIPGDSAA